MRRRSRTPDREALDGRAGETDFATYDTGPFTRGQKAAVLRVFREAATAGSKPWHEVVAKWWPEVQARAWHCMFALIESKEYRKAVDGSIVPAERPPERHQRTDGHRWQRLNRAVRAGRLPVAQLRMEIRVAQRRGDVAGAIVLQDMMNLVAASAERLGLPMNLSLLQGDDLSRAYDEARRYLRDELGDGQATNRTDDAIDGYLEFLAGAYKEITGKAPRRGTTYSATHPKKSGRPSSPGNRFLTAGMGFIPGYSDTQVSDWLKARPKNPRDATKADGTR